MWKRQNSKIKERKSVVRLTFCIQNNFINQEVYCMKVSSICLLSNNVLKLCAFYQKLFKQKPSFLTLEYVEFQIDGLKLAIYSAKKHNEVSNEPSIVDDRLKNILLEIEVTDVDELYQRIIEDNIPIIKELRVESWGSKSFYIRDPEGNIISLYHAA